MAPPLDDSLVGFNLFSVQVFYPIEFLYLQSLIRVSDMKSIFFCRPHVQPNVYSCEVESWCPIEVDKLPAGKSRALMARYIGSSLNLVRSADATNEG